MHSFCDWIYDASKFLPSFGGAVGLLWIKDAVERAQRKRHARRTLWVVLSRELDSGLAMNAYLSILSGISAGHAPDRVLPVQHITATAELTLVELDHERANVYVELSNCAVLLKERSKRTEELLKAYRGEPSAKPFIVGSVCTLASCAIQTMKARHEAMVAVQDAERNPTKRRRALEDSLQEIRAAESKMSEMQAIASEYGVVHSHVLADGAPGA